MTVYILMSGSYREEVPRGVFSTPEQAQAALDTDALSDIHGEPFVKAWAIDGEEVDCDVTLSPEVIAEIDRLKAENRAKQLQRAAERLKSGAIVYSTSSYAPPTTAEVKVGQPCP